MPANTSSTAAQSSICISHKEDVDGISSAAIVKAALDIPKVILVDYANVIAKLEKVAASISSSSSSFASSADNDGGNNIKSKVSELYICDLGLSKKNEARFVELLEKVASSGTEVTYVDHHDISKETASALKKAGVTLVHTIEECTSVQVYNRFKKKLPAHAAFFAAMGALTDYMETKPAAAGIVSRFDRNFLMLQSTALAYMISANQHNDEFLVKMVDTLAKMKYPHDIKDGFAIAEKYAKKVAGAVESIQDKIVRLDSVAYAPSTVELSASMVVNFVLGSSGKPVAMVYKLKEDIKSYVFSIRGSAECKVHLGRLVNEVASAVGGSGGGHDRACGAVVPKDRLEEFVKAVDKRIA